MNKRSWRGEFLQEQRLPEAYLSTAERYFDPLAKQIARRVEASRTLIVGVNGSQGSGKSTLCDYLCQALEADYDLTSIALSLDDFYLTRAEREALASEVHPLFLTRGVPGTHDLPLLAAILEALSQRAEVEVAVPRFDKAADDRAPVDRWTMIRSPVQVVMVEGWCLGARAVPDTELNTPLNTLEVQEDPQGIWRRYSNQQLLEHYESLYRRIDYWVMLAAPGFEQVLQWRSEQEAKLRDAVAGAGAGLMDDAALQRFVAHFERHTRQCLKSLPESVDVLLQLNAKRNIIEARGLES